MKQSSGTPTLNAWVTFGDHLYRKKGDDPSIVFTSASGEKRTIVDYHGKILDFPGIDAKDEITVKRITERDDIEPLIRYRTEFKRCDDGNIIMIWEVQPDGMYWADEDGYGMTSDEEIRLYSFIDEEGRFTAPFRLYSIGSKQFFGVQKS
ncbi:MAG: hypothetical protein II877_04705 [Synergistaceae bacterium]|nr:hypothetical protein [Synergistaceae bacterium]MBR0256268.1 hypothetical protein [Synergistaceae bacterium]